MKQTTRRWWGILCCQPNFEWTVHEYVRSYEEGQAIADKLYIMEDAPYCGRVLSCAAPGGRPTVYNVHSGGIPGPGAAPGPLLFTHRKNWTFGQNQLLGCDPNGNQVRIPCCCCLPYLETRDADGRHLGTSRYVCDECLFVPKFKVEDPEGNKVFRIRTDTCCGGCCVRCVCGQKGGRCCAIPFYIQDPSPPHGVLPAHDFGDGTPQAEVTMLWPGMAKSCCQRQNYALKFPAGATPDMKATLMGFTLLLDMTMFEQQQ